MMFPFQNFSTFAFISFNNFLISFFNYSLLTLFFFQVNYVYSTVFNIISPSNKHFFHLQKMTKLLEWISVLSAFFAIWYSFVGGFVQHPLIDKWMNIIMISPIILVILFGIYAVTVVLYRVFTFNDCEDAAKELQAEILEAKKDLKEKGVVW